MKLTAVICDASMAANVGGNVEVTTQTFPMPPEIEALIRRVYKNTYAHVTFAIDKTDEVDKP